MSSSRAGRQSSSTSVEALSAGEHRARRSEWLRGLAEGLYGAEHRVRRSEWFCDVWFCRGPRRTSSTFCGAGLAGYGAGRSSEREPSRSYRQVSRCRVVTSSRHVERLKGLSTGFRSWVRGAGVEHLARKHLFHSLVDGLLGFAHQLSLDGDGVAAFSNRG